MLYVIQNYQMHNHVEAFLLLEICQCHAVVKLNMFTLSMVQVFKVSLQLF